MSYINYNIVKELSYKFVWIPNIIKTDKELLTYIDNIDSYLLNDLYDYLYNKNISIIKKILSIKEDLMKKDILLSPYIDILENYDKNIYTIYISSKIVYKYELSIKEIEDDEIDIDILDLIRLTKGSIIRTNDYTIPLKSKLKNHQLKCFNYIKNRDKTIVIAATGSGKTLISISYAEYLFSVDKIDKVIVFVENNPEIYRRELIKHLKQYALSKYQILTYNELHKINKNTNDYNRTLFIMDEIHLLKNKSIRGLSIKNINMQYYLGLTATIVDKKSDLYTLFNNLNIIVENKSEDVINTLIRRYIYKINTEDIENEYNIQKEKIKILLDNKLYSTYIKTEQLITMTDNNFFKRIHGLSNLLSTYNNKIDEIYNIISRHNKDQIIIFVNYLTSLEKIYDSLKYIDNVDTIHGEMTRDKKNKIIDSFIKKKTRILIATSVIRASYNLQSANVMIFYEQNYEVIKKIQAEGRIKRIGQDKKIYMYELYYADTIEEDIIETLELKIIELNNIQNLQDTEIIDILSKKIDDRVSLNFP